MVDESLNELKPSEPDSRSVFKPIPYRPSIASSGRSSSVVVTSNKFIVKHLKQQLQDPQKSKLD
jgi:hypothetical protein